MSGIKILMVDDEPDVIATHVHFLRNKIDGCVVDVAESGNKAAAKFDDSPYDIIVSDFRMPDGNGSDLLEYVMNHPTHTRPIFYFMSGFSDLSLEQLLSKGASGLLEKPVKLRDLLDLINKEIQVLKSA